MSLAYVALGSNLGDPPRQLQAALIALTALPQTTSLRHSALYRSPPWDGSAQPEYCNAVAELHWSGTPLQLLATLQALEQAAGRQRKPADRNAPRTLDLDLLWFDGQTLELPQLSLPHPRMLERAFVICPLAELAPQLVLADGSSAEDQARRLADQPLRRDRWPGPRQRADAKDC